MEHKGCLATFFIPSLCLENRRLTEQESDIAYVLFGRHGEKLEQVET